MGFIPFSHKKFSWGIFYNIYALKLGDSKVMGRFTIDNQPASLPDEETECIGHGGKR